MKAPNQKDKNLSFIEFRPTLFWDVNPETIDPDQHARYIIERILEFGNDEEVRWMWRYYDHQLIGELVNTSRALSSRTKIFWQLMLTRYGMEA